MRSKEIEGLLSDGVDYDKIKDLITGTMYVVSYEGRIKDQRFYESESEFIHHLNWLGSWNQSIDYHMKIEMGEYLSFEYDLANEILYPSINVDGAFFDEVYTTPLNLCTYMKDLHDEHLDILTEHKLGKFINKI